jgi:hypothetical protein
MDRATAGVALEYDLEQERFVDHERANTLTTRVYREPFVLPDPA